MTRIIAGRWAGARLDVPDTGTRPTSDRVREALFSALAHEFGTLDGVAVLDLYAGSGALALEAASRGASPVVTVDRAAAATAVLARNAARLPGCAIHVVRADVGRWLRGTVPGDVGGPLDIVLADPPYDHPPASLDTDLADLAGRGWLAPAAVLVVERARRSREPRWPDGVAGTRSRRYGDTVLWYGLGQG